MNETQADTTLSPAACGYCGGPITAPPTIPPRRYCSPQHKALSYQQRRRQRDRVDKVFREEVIAVEQPQHEGEPVFPAAAQPDEPAWFVAGPINEHPSRTRLGYTFFECTVVGRVSGIESNRGRELDGDELNFVRNALSDRRSAGIDAAVSRLQTIIHYTTGCPRPVGSPCEHPPHVARRRRFTELAEYFGLLP